MAPYTISQDKSKKHGCSRWELRRTHRVNVRMRGSSRKADKKQRKRKRPPDPIPEDVELLRATRIAHRDTCYTRIQICAGGVSSRLWRCDQRCLEIVFQKERLPRAPCTKPKRGNPGHKGSAQKYLYLGASKETDLVQNHLSVDETVWAVC